MEGAFKPQGRWRIARSAVSALLIAFGIATTTTSVIPQNNTADCNKVLVNSNTKDKPIIEAVQIFMKSVESEKGYNSSTYRAYGSRLN